MFLKPSHSSLTSKTSNLSPKDKHDLNPNHKKVLKNQSIKGRNQELRSIKTNSNCQPAVVWKSTRGRTQEKQWSCQEQQRLFLLHEQLGNRWTLISKHFPGKTDNDVKNRLFSRFRLGVRQINKIIQVSSTNLRPIKMSIISKIVSVCDSRFQESITTPASLLRAALDLRRDLLAFLYEHPSNSLSSKVHKLIKQLHSFWESFASWSKNSQRSSDCEDEDLPDPEENNHQQEENALQLEKEWESHPTRVQDHLQQVESEHERQPVSVVESILSEFSIMAADVAILAPDFHQPIFVGDPFSSLHYSESLLPPIRSDEAYQYQKQQNLEEYELYDFLTFSI